MSRRILRDHRESLIFQSASGLSVGGRGGEKCRRWRLRQSTCQATPRADFIREPRPGRPDRRAFHLPAQCLPAPGAMAQSLIAGGRITASAGSNLLGQHAVDRNQEATVYVGNLDPQVRRQSGPKSRPEFEKPSGSIARLPVICLPVRHAPSRRLPRRSCGRCSSRQDRW